MHGPVVGSLSPLISGLDSVAVAILLCVLGYLVADAVTASRGADAVTRCGLAFPGLLAYSLLLMLVHIATGGRLLHSPVAVRAVVAASVVVLVVQRMLRSRNRDRPRVRPATVELVSLASLLTVGLIVWGWPVFRMLPVNWSNDIDIIHHMGWTSELLNGESLPSGPLSGHIPNYYPWLYHGLLAVTSQLEPTGRAFMSLGAVQFLQVTGALTGLFALGWRLTGKWITGASAALLGGLSGGFGFLVSGVPHLIFGPGLRSPAVGTYFGDFLYRRSYHLAFQNLSPPLPRDVSYALLPAFLLLVTLGLVERRTWWLWLAGIVLGIEGLIGAESFVVGLILAALVSLVPRTLPRRRAAVALLGPGLGLWALWSVPLLINYVHYHGFRDLLSAPVSLPPLDILGGWGIVTPLAVVGALVWLRRWKREPPIRVVVLVLVAATIPMIASLLVPPAKGFSTLQRDQRYWPLFFLGIALLGALGLTLIIDRARSRGRAVAAGTAILAIALTLPSPMLASVAFVRDRIPDRLVTDTLQGDVDTVLAAMGEARKPLVVAVPEELQEAVSAYTGYRMVAFGHVKRQARWKTIFGEIGGARRRASVNQALTSGSISPARFRKLASSYDVDVAVIRLTELTPTYPFCTRQPPDPNGYVVVFIDQPVSCAGHG
jgi:hypothetical protein